MTWFFSIYHRKITYMRKQIWRGYHIVHNACPIMSNTCKVASLVLKETTIKGGLGLQPLWSFSIVSLRPVGWKLVRSYFQKLNLWATIKTGQLMETTWHRTQKSQKCFLPYRERGSNSARSVSVLTKPTTALSYLLAAKNLKRGRKLSEEVTIRGQTLIPT